MRDDLQIMESMWSELKNSNLSSYKRSEIYYAMIALYHNSIIVKEHWEHHPSKHLYKDRFVRCIRIRSLKSQTISRRVRKNNAFDDGINYDAPMNSGLYLVGSTYFNPITDDKYYWVKVGRASNIEHRMNEYNTCCAMLYRIDYKRIDDKIECRDAETYYHKRLFDISLATCNHNKEWFLVNKETYLEICEKGFAYFD